MCSKSTKIMMRRSTTCFRRWKAKESKKLFIWTIRLTIFWVKYLCIRHRKESLLLRHWSTSIFTMSHKITKLFQWLNRLTEVWFSIRRRIEKSRKLWILLQVFKMSLLKISDSNWIYKQVRFFWIEMALIFRWRSNANFNFDTKDLNFMYFTMLL